MQSTINHKRAYSCGIRRVLGQVKLKLKRLRLFMVALSHEEVRYQSLTSANGGEASQAEILQ
jgi:hypothetical protein